jgi:hypothetical protein
VVAHDKEAKMNDKCKNPDCVDGMIYEDRCTPIPCPDCQPEQPSELTKRIRCQIEPDIAEALRNVSSISPVDVIRLCDIIDQQAAKIERLKKAIDNRQHRIIRLTVEVKQAKDEYRRYRKQTEGDLRKIGEQAADLKAKEEIIDELEADRRDLQLIIITKNGELKAKDEEIAKLWVFINNWDMAHEKDCGALSQGFEGCDQTMFNCDCGIDKERQALKGDKGDCDGLL